MSRAISTRMDTEDDAQLIREYAKSRGARTTGELLRWALFEYARRHRPKEGTELRERIDSLLREREAVTVVHSHDSGNMEVGSE